MHPYPYRPPRRSRSHPARDPVVATAATIVRDTARQQASHWRAACEARWFDVIVAYAHYDGLPDGPERDAQRWAFAVQVRQLREDLDTYMQALRLAYDPGRHRRWPAHPAPRPRP